MTDYQALPSLTMPGHTKPRLTRPRLASPCPVSFDMPAGLCYNEHEGADMSTQAVDHIQILMIVIIFANAVLTLLTILAHTEKKLSSDISRSS